MGEKVALVTGASRGIGKAVAEALSAQGFQVAIHYRSKELEAHNLATRLGNGAKAYKADLAIEAEIAQLVKDVKEHYGRIDVLVNNAGMTIDQVLAFAKPEDFELLIRTNLWPVFYLCKLIGKMMMRQKSGRIINLSSVIGHSGNAGQSMYAATKGAISAFTRSLALELAPFQILANCVAPGMIATDMTQNLSESQKSDITNRIPLRRMGHPDEVAQVVAFLASPQASYITGSTLHVNGGMLTS